MVTMLIYIVGAERGDYVVRRDEEVEGVYFLLQGQVHFSEAHLLLSLFGFVLFD